MSRTASHDGAPLPAHKTKHVPTLDYTFGQCVFRLAQLDDGNTNGTALWMGAQVLSAWLVYVLDNKNPSKQASGRRPRVLELGSGIGLSALALCSLGWDVVATDLPDVIDSVLADNISKNWVDLPAGCGTIQVRALDWTVSPAEWIWNHGTIIASSIIPTATSSETHTPTLGAPFNLIITSDTVYSPELVDPLLRALGHLYTISLVENGPRKAHHPLLYVCIERRDPTLVDQFLDKARESFSITKIQPRKVSEAMQHSGLRWSREDWEGMEIWAFKQTRPKGTSGASRGDTT